jgi:hypothetical protein
MVSAADKLSNARSIVADVAEHGDEFWTSDQNRPACRPWRYV